MLFRSGDNLEAGAIEFINENEEITLYAAYLKLDELQRINKSNKIKQIVVRWEIEDLCKQISDLAAYQYCMDQEIALFRNTRLHAKVFWNNSRSVLLGSANVTNRGLGEHGNFNFELNGIVHDLDALDLEYLNKLVLESEYVDATLYQKVKALVEEVEMPTYEFPVLPTPPPTVDYFLINQLPMTESPEQLYEIYSAGTDDELELKCSAHDLQLYQLPKGLNKEEFMSFLQDKFNNHPFIVKFKEAVRNSKDRYGREERNGTMNFGSVRRWFAENTTTVPTPRAWDLTNNTRILYDWICCLDHKFKWNRPSQHTQVISCNCS